MNEPLIVFAWTVGGTAAFGLVGMLFGGLTGYFTARSGRAAGTGLGRRVAAALSRLAAGDITDVQRNTLVGAVDGGFFLGLVGLLLGLVAGWRGLPPQDWLLPVFSITLLVATLALFFGLLALGMVHWRLRAIMGASIGGVIGASLAVGLFGALHTVPGLVGGLALGVIVAAVIR